MRRQDAAAPACLTMSYDIGVRVIPYREDLFREYEIGVEANYKHHYPFGSFALFRSDVDDMIDKRELTGDAVIYNNTYSL